MDYEPADDLFIKSNPFPSKGNARGPAILIDK